MYFIFLCSFRKTRKLREGESSDVRHSSWINASKEKIERGGVLGEIHYFTISHRFGGGSVRIKFKSLPVDRETDTIA